MNRTFKVVFNRARAGLMVANEITSSVQKKGTKTVVAAVAIGLFSAGAFAESLSSWTGESTPNATQSYEFTGSQYTDGNSNYVAALDVENTAKGAIENLSITVNAIGPKGGEHIDKQPLGVRNHYGIVDFGGQRLDIGVTTDFVGSGNSQCSAIDLLKENDSPAGFKTTISADKVNLNIASTNAKGKAVYGIGIGADLTVSSSEMEVNLNTATERASDEEKNTYSEAIGIDVHSASTLDAEKLKSLKITGKSTGKTKTTNGKNGASSIYGIVFEGGTGNIGGNTEIDVSADGGNAVGVKATNYFYNTSFGDKWGNSAGTLNNLTVKAKSTQADAMAAQVSYTTGPKNTLLLKVNGKADLTANSTEGNAYGIKLVTTQNGKAEFLGDVAISSSSEKSFANGVRQSGGTVILGSEGKSVTISANGFSDEEKGPTTKAVMLEENGVLTIEGKTIAISSNGRGLQASEPSTMKVGNREKTEVISIESESMGVFALDRAKIEMQAQKISVVSSASGIGAIHTQNNQEKNEEVSGGACVTINADNLEVTNTAKDGAGLSAFSNGKLVIDANLMVKATNALDVRGNSFVDINTGTSTQKATKLDGNIVFETPWTTDASHNSGKLINSHVTVNLSGNDSYWNGRSYQEYNEKTSVELGTVPDYGAVTDFALTVSNGAQWTLSDDSFVNTLTLKDGGIIDATKAAEFNVGTWENGRVEPGFTVSGTGNKLTLGEKTELSGTITMENGSELITPLDTAFKDIEKESDVITGGVGRLDIKGPNSGFATLTINDIFTLTPGAFTQFGDAYKSVALNLANATLKLGQSEQAINIPTDVALGAITDKRDVNVNGKKLTISGNGKESSIGTLDFGMDNNSGSLSAKNNTVVNIEKLTGNGGVYVGEREGAGAKMFINNLAMTRGHIFVDPYYGHSVLGINALESDTLSTSIIAGDGALVTIGTASEADARAALAKVDGAASAKSVVFMKKAISVGEDGSLYIDPRATEQTEVNAQGVVVNQDGLLAVDQTAVGTSAVFTNASQVKFDGGKLAVVNAAPGTLTMVGTSSAETDSGEQVSASMSGLTTASVLTDNPFVSVAGVSDTAVTLEASASQEGMSTLASMGIQSMIRRADMVLAETIADRMASEVQTGSNLWVDVRGERYERDNLDNGAGFKADIGYGAFGAELAPTETTTLGVAFQYGNGTVKGDVANVKNKTKDYGFALYGSAMLGDTGVKGIGEVAYTKSTNDITSSLALMNQDTDATMLSAGVKAQKSFDLGTFEVIPSLGVRVSHIKTDAMQAGNVQIEKQKQTIVQIPLALRVNAKATETASGWSVTPKFKVAFIPTVGDKSIEVFGVKQSVIDTSPVQGSFGVGFAKGNLTIDAAAHLGAGNKGTSAVGGKVGLTYRF